MYLVRVNRHIEPGQGITSLMCVSLLVSEFIPTLKALWLVEPNCRFSDDQDLSEILIVFQIRGLRPIFWIKNLTENFFDALFFAF